MTAKTMVAPNNPKKKRTYANATTSTKDAAAMEQKKEPDSLSSTSTKGDITPAEMIEQHLGPTLLTGVGEPPKPTKDLLEGKELVALYFGGSWSDPCKKFTPTLVDFYHQCQATQNGMEVIYVSSDNDQASFHEYYGSMPWLAMDGNIEGVRLKHALATSLKAFSLPTMVILDLKSGNFITDQARKEVLEVMKPAPTSKKEDTKKNEEEENEGGKDDTDQKEEVAAKGKALMESWKERDPSPIGSADGGGPLDSVASALAYFTKNPHIGVMIVLLLAFTPVIQHVTDNPMLGIVFWYLLKNLGKEKLSRNEPYDVQVPAATPDLAGEENDSVKDKDQ